MVTSASASGSPSERKSGTSRPPSSASASVGRNGTPGGIDRTRGAAPLIWHSASARATAASASAMASGVPTVIQLSVHLHAEQPPGGDRRVEIAVERLRADRGILRRCADGRWRRRHRSGRPGRRRARASAPSGADAENPSRRCGRSLMRDPPASAEYPSSPRPMQGRGASRLGWPRSIQNVSALMM